MTPAEQTRAGLAAAIAALRFAEAGARQVVRDAWDTAETPITETTLAALKALGEHSDRIRQARQAMEWETTQAPTPDAPMFNGSAPWAG